MNFSLIVPIAADKEDYRFRLPQAFSFNREGMLQCISAIMGLNLDVFDKIFFTILKTHNEQYCLKELLELQFRRMNLKRAEIIILDELTRSQAETVFETIKKGEISGSIFIKDADCFFSADLFPHNSVAIYPLEELNTVNPQHKSYVAVDDMFYITNIIEKRIVSHYFNAGGYCFEDIKDFNEYYLRYKEKKGLCLSHIIYSMLLDGFIFKPQLIENYKDFELTE